MGQRKVGQMHILKWKLIQSWLVCDKVRSADVTKCTDIIQIMDENMEDCPLSDKSDDKKATVEDLEDSPEMPQKPQNEIRRDISLSQIVEGKREKKLVKRLDFQVVKPKRVLKVEMGSGDKLGNIARVNHQLGKLKVPDLKPLHIILFDMPGKIATMRKNMRLFNGFPFEVNSDPYIKKKERMSKLTCAKLRSICTVLDLEKGGNQSVLIDRIITFLMSPRISGKPVISKRKKRSKKNISTKDTKSKTKAKSTSGSPRKAKAESKSKAIVTDSSSDDDDDDDDDEPGVSAEVDGSIGEKKSGMSRIKDKVLTDDSDEDDNEDGEEATTKPAARNKRTAAKTHAQPVKKTVSTRKKMKALDSDSENDDDDDEDKGMDHDVEEKPKNKATAKRPRLAKPAAKTKKADSSSNRQKTTVTAGKSAFDSSDDDEPLIKMIKKPPTDEQLKETVMRLLKDANLEEMTMKQICQKVYNTYPEFDLTCRRDYVKQTVKDLISQST
ncbi:hypothetical protein DPEC_G00352540 [Dallia pectoralis]|uniref:Uncharacterized protein n=1 Tax=Dallia pectoralis TaxID=75939 RepID=A0ACC2F2B4_DALPE|nr:hypothetical protein DPEC_G00352540 [Dallia pectoralis]